jgi:hypothetical protein
MHTVRRQPDIKLQKKCEQEEEKPVVQRRHLTEKEPGYFTPDSPGETLGHALASPGSTELAEVLSSLRDVIVGLTLQAAL